MPRRLAGLLAGLWAGGLLTIAAVAAPAAFAQAARDVAGRIAGQMFAVEAHAGLVIAVALILLQRVQARRPDGEIAGSLFNAELMLVLGAVFCTVAGYFALQPMMAAARAGQGALSFGALHGISVGFFGLKTALLLVLAWRLSAR